MKHFTNQIKSQKQNTTFKIILTKNHKSDVIKVIEGFV